MRLFFAVLFAALLARVASAQHLPPVITNLVAVQRPGAFYVDVTYDLIAPDSPGGVYILAQASADGGTNYSIPMPSLSGDVFMVIPGAGKKLVWNAWADWPRNYTTNARVRLIAEDHWTTNVPPAANLVWIPSGAFNMEGTYVWLTKGIWMGKCDVTQAEYQNVMSNNPSYFQGYPNRPVEQVSWFDAVQYCQTLTARARAAGLIDTNWTYRLPTEAEWEYACRAGTTNTYFFGEDPGGTLLGTWAWYSVNSGGQTHDVGTRAPNQWGLYDIIGNVWQWCQDWYAALPGGNVTDPQGPSSGSSRVMRGGSWYSGASGCASAYRGNGSPSYRDSDYGFRVVLAPVQ